MGLLTSKSSLPKLLFRWKCFPQSSTPVWCWEREKNFLLAPSSSPTRLERDKSSIWQSGKEMKGEAARALVWRRHSCLMRHHFNLKICDNFAQHISKRGVSVRWKRRKKFDGLCRVPPTETGKLMWAHLQVYFTLLLCVESWADAIKMIEKLRESFEDCGAEAEP